MKLGFSCSFAREYLLTPPFVVKLSFLCWFCIFVESYLGRFVLAYFWLLPSVCLSFCHYLSLDYYTVRLEFGLIDSSHSIPIFQNIFIQVLFAFYIKFWNKLAYIYKKLTRVFIEIALNLHLNLGRNSYLFYDENSPWALYVFHLFTLSLISFIIFCNFQHTNSIHVRFTHK